MNDYYSNIVSTERFTFDFFLSKSKISLLFKF